MEIKATLDKPYTDEERVEFIVTQNHNNGYEIRETETQLQAWGKDSSELLEIHRQAKYKENEKVRDAFLLSGVTYKNVVFDSDTDQKVNILATVNTMGETDTINWYGLDGVSYLECTKADLLNIGNLISLTTAYVWQQRNPEIKDLIAKATTIAELDAIEITYEPVTL